MGLRVLLTGTYHRTLDEKLRLALPKSLRDALGDAAGRPLFLAPGSDGSLALFPESSFERLATRLAAAPPTALEVREYRRLFYARAVRAELDRQGRLRIPQPLAEVAGLGRDVVLLGVDDHAEIWDQARWEDYLGSRLARYDAISEAAFGGTAGAVRPDQSEEVVQRPPR
jgi:MraZ protein